MTMLGQTITFETRFRGEIPLSELNAFVANAADALAGGVVSIQKDPFTGHPTDPGGVITIRVIGQAKTDSHKTYSEDQS